MILTVDAKVDNWGQVLEFIDEQLQAQNCPMRAMLEIDVAAEEIFVNVASYAYESGVGTVDVKIDFEDNPKAVVIRFSDRGMPYDPLKKADPDITLPAEKRQIGGLGIYMVKKSMDGVFYEYKDGQNHLTIRKLFERSKPSFLTKAKEK